MFEDYHNVDVIKLTFPEAQDLVLSASLESG